MTMASAFGNKCILDVDKFFPSDPNRGAVLAGIVIEVMGQDAINCELYGLTEDICHGNAEFWSPTTVDYLTYCKWGRICESGKYWSGSSCLDADTQNCGDCASLMTQYKDNDCCEDNT